MFVNLFVFCTHFTARTPAFYVPVSGHWLHGGGIQSDNGSTEAVRSYGAMKSQEEIKDKNEEIK